MLNEMKPSEVIQLALDDHYLVDPKYVIGKSTFMCHAIAEVFRLKGELSWGDAYRESDYVIQTFMPEIRTKDTDCLSNYLKQTNNRYAKFRARYGDDSRVCIRMRVEFWNNHIAALKEKGL